MPRLIAPYVRLGWDYWKHFLYIGGSWIPAHIYTSYLIADKCMAKAACRKYVDQASDASWFGHGLHFDHGDHQWNMFRDQIPDLVKAMFLCAFLSRLVRSCSPQHSIREILILYSILGFGAVLYIHEAFALHIFLIVFINFIISRLCGTLKLFNFGLGPIFAWLFGIFVVIGGEWYNRSLSFANLFGDQYRIYDYSYQGKERWWICVNMLMLRMVSANVDYYNMLVREQDMERVRKEGGDVTLPDTDSKFSQWLSRHFKKCSDCSQVKNELEKGNYLLNTTCYALHEQIPQNNQYYTFPAYFSYVTYMPLYLAGPIMSFNAFLFQLRIPPKVPLNDIAAYGGRIFFCFLVMEICTSYFTCFAVLRSHLYADLGAWQIMSFTYMNLQLIWLKFLVIWRFFRLWAVLDGIVPVENMNRCIANELGRDNNPDNIPENPML